MIVAADAPHPGGMMRTLLVLAITLAPAMAHALDLPVRLPDGATWTQKSVHSRNDVRGGASKSNTATSVIRMTYRQDGPVGLVRQDFISFDVEGVEGDELKALADQAKLIYPAVIEVDETLRPSRVRDWDRVREIILAAIGAGVTDPRALEAVSANYTKMDDVQAAALFREQGLVALGQGTGLELDETHQYEDEIPNILGGPPIKTVGAFRLESIDETKGSAVVTWAQEPDRASLNASLKVSMAAMAARLAPEQRAQADVLFVGLTLERAEMCRYEIDIPTGLAATTDCTVEIKSGLKGQLAQRTDRWIVTQSLTEPQ